MKGEYLKLVKEAKEDEATNPNDFLTPEKKKNIEEFLKTAGKIKDSDFHAFIEKLGVNIHTAEAYVYGLAQKYLNPEDTTNSEPSPEPTAPAPAPESDTEEV